MKVGILTHYSVNNQGAQLQLYGLYNFLKEAGHDVYVQTYRKNYDFDTQNWEKRNEISIKSTGYILKEFLLKKGIKLTYHNYKKYKLNTNFRKNNFKFCRYALEPLDLSVVGSDEVLSLQSGANIMMYGHCVNAKALMAYAPCIGLTTLGDVKKWHCEALISSGLKMFSALSARDERTAEIMTELTGVQNIPIVCDPVLLYDFSKIKVPYKKIKEKYLIAYTYDRYFVDEKSINAIKSYAKSKGLKVASVGTYHKWCDYNIACDPLEWIEYFRDAQEVITTTFHGTILSIITDTPMAVISKQPKVLSVLENLGLTDRRMMTIDDISSVMSKQLDFDAMHEKLNSLREKSKSYLLSNIEKIKEEIKNEQ